MVKDLYRGESGSGLTWATIVGDTVFFAAEKPSTGLELWSVPG